MILAIDTTGPDCAAALLQEGTIVAARSDAIGRGHAEHLMPMLEDMMRAADVEWQAIETMACTTGPGSFTGLRVGLAAARGLALALDCPCIGISVFEAVAASHPDQKRAVVMDARRDQVWLQTFDAGNEATCEARSALLDDAADIIRSSDPEIKNLHGSGAELLSARDAHFLAASSEAAPNIKMVARLALSKDPENHPPKPLYLRSPDAKPQSPARVAQ